MRNKFLKGLSVAFAAAMAFTVVAPALTTEAASTKAYVVSKMVDEGGLTHKFTYDSRGRVTKEVITNNGETEEYTIQGTSRDNLGEIRYSIYKDGVEQYRNSTDYTLTTATEVVKESTTKTKEEVVTITYYNSGAKKDKVKSKNSKITESEIYIYDSNLDDNDGAYGKVKEESVAWDYTYNSKGVNTTMTETSTNNDNWVYTYTSGKDYEYDRTTAAGVSMTVNDVAYGTKYDDIKTTNPYAACFNGASHINNQYVTTTKYTYNKRNSLGQATDVDANYDVYVYSPMYSPKADGSGEYLAYAYTYAVSSLKGGNTSTTYTKVGQPKKQVVTHYGDLQEQTVGQWYNEDGDQIAAPAMYATFMPNFDSGLLRNDGADYKETAVYTYGKDQHLAKKVYNGYDNEDDVVSSLSATTTVLSWDNDTKTLVAGKTADGYAQVTITTSSEPLNKVEITTTYNPTLQANSGLISAKTSETRMYEGKINGKDGYNGNSVETYTLKKISVPSSRATQVLMDTWQLQTDIQWK